MLVKDKAGITSMIGSLRRSNFLFYDIESTGFDPYTERLVMLQFWNGEGEVYIIDARDAQPKGLGKLVAPIFYEAKCIIGHNLKFDLSWSRVVLGIDTRRLADVWDTMIAEQYLLGVGLTDGKKQKKEVNLKATAHRHGVGEMSKEERNWFIGLDKRPDEWAAPFPAQQLEYAEKDVHVLKPIFNNQRRAIKAREMTQAIRDESGALLGLVEAETNGIPVDAPKWRAFIAEKGVEAAGLGEEASKSLNPPIQRARLRRFDEQLQVYRAWEGARDAELERLKGLWAECGYNLSHDITGGVGMFRGWGDFKTTRMKIWREEHPNPKKPALKNEINLGSPKQIVEALNEMGIEVESAKVEVLEEIAEDHPEIATLLLWRKSIKFVQSFGESLLSKINPVTGRIHPSFHQIGASTGRMSSSNPNFQQIPSKGDGQRIRECVIAPPGCKLLVADYSGQELMILADQSGDEKMLDFLLRGVDLHGETARLMFGLGPDIDPKKYEVAPGVSARAAAKTINYGIAYGMSSYALAMDLKVEPDRGEELMNNWYSAYPQASKWLEKQGKYTQDHLISPTATGWVRRFQPIPMESVRPYKGTSEDWKAYYNAKKERTRLLNRLSRQGKNTPIQGCAAGITKKALAYIVRGCYTSLKGSLPNTKLKILAVVHDEIVLEVKQEDAAEVAEYLADCMDKACTDVLKRVHVPRTQVVISDHWMH